MAVLTVVVVPRASREAVGPWRDGELRVRVTPPPADGEANRAVIRAVARSLRVPNGSVDVVSGTRTRRKRLEIRGLTDDELERRLASLAD